MTLTDEQKKDLGLHTNLNLFGSINILNIEPNKPIIFLFDENHDIEDCINRNIKNAETLIKRANVVIVGLERLPGGKEWNPDSMDYVREMRSQDNFNPQPYDSHPLHPNHNLFSDWIKNNYPFLLQGVESRGMHDMIDTDCYEGKYTVENHPLNQERSKHFIQTLFDAYSSRGLNGNMILNCGLQHNNDIENWISSEEITDITGRKASFIRINTI